MKTSIVGENNSTEPEANNGIVQNLPQEIVEEILSWLPIESIMTCRRVCKSWCKTIKDPSFVNLQLKRSRDQPLSYVLQDTGIGRFSSRWSQSGGKLFFLGTTEGEKAKELSKIPLLGGGSVKRRSISSCNGLLCIAPTDDSETPIVVCNPITKEHTVLPKPEDIGQYGFGNQVGIGFDASSNKYKVARMYYLTANDNESYSFCEIITVGEDKSWRKIDLPFNGGFKVIPTESGGAVFWEGALHWICVHVEDRQWAALFILRFDISKEEFQFIQRHYKLAASGRGKKLQLLELEGSLILEELTLQHPSIGWQHGTIRVFRFRKSVTTGEICDDRISLYGNYTPPEEDPPHYTLSDTLNPYKQLLSMVSNRVKDPKFSPDIIPDKLYSRDVNKEEVWKMKISHKLLSVASNEEYWKVSPNKIMFWFPGEERYAHQEVQGIPKSFIPSGFRPTLVSIYSTNSLT
ncbi:hypothetical protein Tsubulata_050980 [Turnera subulata]|uniref:F-box domain-containing protein n=1 Tax=Turnera subulata TaxID=218843 RepID=A0A9Q0F1Z9_9ROSI|nr:hypothetical protein Tsubulata_050980 [Turnera subulata]